MSVRTNSPVQNPINLLGLKCLCHIRKKLLWVTCFTYKMKEKNGGEEWVMAENMRNIQKSKFKFRIILPFFFISFLHEKILIPDPTGKLHRAGSFCWKKWILKEISINLLSANRNVRGCLHPKFCGILSILSLFCYLFSQWFSMKRSNHTQKNTEWATTGFLQDTYY